MSNNNKKMNIIFFQQEVLLLCNTFLSCSISPPLELIVTCLRLYNQTVLYNNVNNSTNIIFISFINNPKIIIKLRLFILRSSNSEILSYKREFPYLFQLNYFTGKNLLDIDFNNIDKYNHSIGNYTIYLFTYQILSNKNGLIPNINLYLCI